MVPDHTIRSGVDSGHVEATLPALLSRQGRDPSAAVVSTARVAANATTDAAAPAGAADHAEPCPARATMSGERKETVTRTMDLDGVHERSGTQRIPTFPHPASPPMPTPPPPPTPAPQQPPSPAKTPDK